MHEIIPSERPFHSADHRAVMSVCMQSPSIYSELPCHLREPAACRLLSATAFSILLLLKLVLGACGYVAFGAQTQVRPWPLKTSEDL